MINLPIFYITNDVSRGIGVENLLPNYHIICLDDHPLVDYLAQSGIKVFCLERVLKQRNQIFRSTSKVIDHPLVLDYLKKESQGQTPQILFFKPSPKIDFICKKYGFNSLGNPASLNREFEEKTQFFEKCLKEKIPVPEGEIGIFGQFNFRDLVKKYHLPLVIQFGRGWAGSTTYFVENEDQFLDLKRLFLKKKIKIVRFIEGKTVLNNACIFRHQILVGPPAQQIGAIKGLTSLPGATCGRQWPANLTPGQEKEIERLTDRVGQIMNSSGYRGYFGLDFIVENRTGKIFLSENNARLTASVPFFSKLEQKADENPLLLYHISSFLDDYPIELTNYDSSDLLGSEVVLRNDSFFSVKIKEKFLPGIYRMNNHQLVFLRPEYFSEKMENDEFWLTCANQDRIVNPEIEIARAIFLKKVLDEEGKLQIEVINLFKVIKEKLGLKKCQR